MGILDDVANESNKPQATPAAAPQPAQQAPASSGSLLDQVAQESQTEATKPPVVNNTPSAPETLGEKALRIEGNALSWLLPEDNKTLNWVNEHVAQPPVRMGKETGNILANRGIKALAYGDEAMDDLEADLFGGKSNRTEVPDSIKKQGLEAEYLANRFTQENPRITGVTTASLKFLGEIAGNPTNWPLMGAGAAKSALLKSFTKVFGTQMAVSAISEGKDLWDNWGQMNTEQKWEAMTNLALHAYVARQAMKGHGTGKAGEPNVEPTKVSGKPVETQTHGATEVPVSQQHAEALRTGEPVEAGEGKAEELKRFQQKQTAPAATAAVRDIVGQSAKDMVNKHDAIISNTALPEKVSGTDTPSGYNTMDDAANALRTKASETTYKKADDISARETQAYKQEVDRAMRTHQEGIDHYNQLVDEHNANLDPNDPEAKPMDRIYMDPSDVKLPEKPKTYTDLKAQLDRIEADLKSPDEAVRQQAHEDQPKAQKALDQWFKSHVDEITPEEYTSAKRMTYAAARFQEFSNSLRANMENNNLTGNKIRSTIASIDNRMIRRGEAPEAFRRLVGDDVYTNMRKVAKLFDPIDTTKPSTMTYGKLAASYVLHHFLGPLGLVGKVGMHFLMDRVLSRPEWGDWFSNVSGSLRNMAGNAVELPQTLLERFKELWSNEHGEAEIPGTGKMGNIGRPKVIENAEAPRESIADNSKVHSDIADQHNKFMGFTYNPEEGFVRDTPVFSVAGKYADTEHVIPGEYITPEHVKQYVSDPKIQDILKNDPTASVGGYRYKGNSHLEISNLFHDKDEAVQAGKDLNQESIYDHEHRALIPTGGSAADEAAATSQFDALKKRYGITKDPLRAGFILPEGEMIPLSGTHDQMLGGTPLENLREDFIAKTGAIRTRYRMSRAGEEQVFSLPPEIDEKQARQIQQAAGKIGQFGQIVLETVDGKNHEIVETPTGRTARQALERLVTIKSEEGPEPEVGGGPQLTMTPGPAGFPEAQVAEKAPALPTPAYKNLNNGFHEVTSKPTGDTSVGQLLAKDVEGNPDAVRVATHWVAPDTRGQGLGAAQLETMAKNLADQGKSLLLSDKDMTDSAKRSWDRLQSQYPDAVKKTASGYLFDLKALSGGEETVPPTEDLAGKEIATRRPTSIRWEPTNEPLYADMSGVEEAGKTAPKGSDLGYTEKLARSVAQYTGLDYLQAEKNPKVVIEKFINHLVDNLVALHDDMPKAMRDIAKQWYDTAHQIAGKIGDRYGYTREQVAAVIAALSPQNAWDNNVGLAERVMDVWKNRQNFKYSPEMEAAEAKVKAGKLSETARQVLKQVHGKTLAEIADQPMKKSFAEKWGDQAEAKFKNAVAVQQAMWLRLYDEAHNSSENDMFHPNGDIVGKSPDSRSWIGLDHVAKAIRLLQTEKGDINAINNLMGDGNKIRNFYNNIINPNSPNGHTTIDTHAVAAALHRPLSGDDVEVMHNFGNTARGVPGAPKDARTGSKGTYPLYAEAYKRAAAKLGLQPRQLQSIVWEGVRSLTGGREGKSASMKAFAKEQWAQVAERKLTPAEARANIKQMAGGYSKPDWMTDEEWEKALPEAGDTSFEYGGGNE